MNTLYAIIAGVIGSLAVLFSFYTKGKSQGKAEQKTKTDLQAAKRQVEDIHIYKDTQNEVARMSDDAVDSALNEWVQNPTPRDGGNS